MSERIDSWYVLGAHPVSGHAGLPAMYDGVDFVLTLSDGSERALGVRCGDLLRQGNPDDGWDDGYRPIPIDLDLDATRHWDFDEILWLGPEPRPCVLWSNADGFTNRGFATLLDGPRASRLLDGRDGAGLPQPNDLGRAHGDLGHTQVVRFRDGAVGWLWLDEPLTEQDRSQLDDAVEEAGAAGHAHRSAAEVVAQSELLRDAMLGVSLNLSTGVFLQWAFDSFEQRRRRRPTISLDEAVRCARAGIKRSFRLHGQPGLVKVDKKKRQWILVFDHDGTLYEARLDLTGTATMLTTIDGR